MAKTTSSAGDWGGTISAAKLLGDIARLMATLPKPDTFLSSRLFPAANAIMVEGGQEKFTVAHPMFWARVEHEARPLKQPDPTSFNLSPLMGIQIIEIDRREDDTPERRAYIDDIWKRLTEAMATAMTPLPDWLKAEPKFGEHG